MSDHDSAPSGGSEGSSRVQPSSVINEGKSAKQKIEGSIFKYALFFLALLMIWNMKACFKTHKQEKAKAAEYAAANPPAPFIPATPRIVKIGKEPTTHQFTDGCVTVWLEGNWVSYPQPLNAKIRFFDQQGRLVLEQGAKKSGSSLYPGEYRICRAPGSDATGVQIWN